MAPVFGPEPATMRSRSCCLLRAGHAATTGATWGMSRRTVSSRGFVVTPPRIFHSVVNGTPDRPASATTCGCDRVSSAARTSAADGMYVDMGQLYR